MQRSATAHSGSFLTFLPHGIEGWYGFGGHFAWMDLHGWCLKMLINLQPGGLGRRDLRGWSRLTYAMFYLMLASEPAADPVQAAAAGFQDRTAQLGLAPGGDGACWADFNQDGWVDLSAGGAIWLNLAGTNFTKTADLGAGVAADFDNDGFTDFFSWSHLRLHRNDGHLDLFFTTVYATASFNKPNHPVLFRNTGGFLFTNVTAAANLSQLPPTYQAAWADFDNDGDLDLLTAGKLFVNQSTGQRWLKVHLAGNGRAVNGSAIGAQVRIRLSDRTLTRQVEAGTGEGNQNELTLHFGLGQHSGPVDLEVFWPNGSTETIRGVEPNRLCRVRVTPVL